MILTWKEYTKAIDMWSVGCIFAELFHRKPLFPGNNYLHQITTILNVLGTPTKEEMEGIESQEAIKYLNNLAPKPKTPLSRLIPSIDQPSLDLIDKMLTFNASKRINAEQALSLPYFTQLSFFDSADLENASTTFNFDFEKRNVSLDDYRDLLFSEMASFHPETLLSQSNQQIDSNNNNNNFNNNNFNNNNNNFNNFNNNNNNNFNNNFNNNNNFNQNNNFNNNNFF